MTSYVLDASVAGKWFLPSAGEPLAAESVQILQAFAAGRIVLSVPDLFWLEMANLLWKSVRVGRISAPIAGEAIESLMAMKIPTLSTKSLVSEALSIALAFQRSVYDSIYVALAVASNRPLLTADERLVNALGTNFPVRWLGAIV